MNYEFLLVTQYHDTLHTSLCRGSYTDNQAVLSVDECRDSLASACFAHPHSQDSRMTPFGILHNLSVGMVNTENRYVCMPMLFQAISKVSFNLSLGLVQEARKAGRSSFGGTKDCQRTIPHQGQFRCSPSAFTLCTRQQSRTRVSRCCFG